MKNNLKVTMEGLTIEGVVVKNLSIEISFECTSAVAAQVVELSNKAMEQFSGMMAKLDSKTIQ